jgi:hypothetical protein
MNIRRVPPVCAALATLAAVPFTTGEAKSTPVGVGTAFVDHGARHCSPSGFSAGRKLRPSLAPAGDVLSTI